VAKKQQKNLQNNNYSHIFAKDASSRFGTLKKIKRKNYRTHNV